MKLTKEERVSMWAQIVWATLSHNDKYKPVLRQLEAHMDASEKEVDELKAELSAKDSALGVDKVQMLGEVHRMMGEIADLREKLTEAYRVIVDYQEDSISAHRRPGEKYTPPNIPRMLRGGIVARQWLTENKVNPND